MLDFLDFTEKQLLHNNFNSSPAIRQRLNEIFEHVIDPNENAQISATKVQNLNNIHNPDNDWRIPGARC